MSGTGSIQAPIVSQLPVAEIDLGSPVSKGMLGKASTGETVLVKTSTSSPLQKATNMAEEIVQFVKDNNKKDLKDRKVKEGNDPSEEMTKRVQKIQTLQNVQEIKDFLQQLKANPNLTREQIQEKLEEAFDGDTLHEFFGLNEAVRSFDDMGDEGSANLLKSIRNDFFNENKVAIKSGINISEAAAKESKETGLSSTRELRETHVKLLGEDKHQSESHTLDHVQDNSSLSQAYQVLIESHGDNKFLPSVQLQQRLLATDLLSFNPSTSSVRLKAVIDDLATLKVLAGLHDGCTETEEQLERMFPGTDFVKHALMPKLLDIVGQQWVTETDFGNLLPVLNISDLETKIFIMTKIDSLVRELPEEIFPNIETKQNMQAAVVEYLDSLIEEENEIDEVPDEGNFGILSDIGLGNSPAVEATVTPTVTTKLMTAKEIAVKAIGEASSGETYQNEGEIFKDIRELSGNPTELQMLINYIDSVDPKFKTELEAVRSYTEDLLDLSKPQNGLDATNQS